MSFALCGPDGILVIIALLAVVVVPGVCLAAAIFGTIALAKWAAARHNRLAANER